MDDQGPRLRQLTKLSQRISRATYSRRLSRWSRALATYVTLFDLEKFPPEAITGGRGADEAEAPLDLWTTLTARPELATRSASWLTPTHGARDERLNGRRSCQSQEPLANRGRALRSFVEKS
jgi:hypothetical protein